MIDRTSTAHAPWTLVEANDKHCARVKVLETLCERLARDLSSGAAASFHATSALKYAGARHNSRCA